MGRRRLYFTDEEQKAAKQKWSLKYRNKIKKELREYRRLKKRMAKG